MSPIQPGPRSCAASSKGEVTLATKPPLPWYADRDGRRWMARAAMSFLPPSSSDDRSPASNRTGRTSGPTQARRLRLERHAVSYRVGECLKRRCGWHSVFGVGDHPQIRHFGRLRRVGMHSTGRREVNHMGVARQLDSTFVSPV